MFIVHLHLVLYMFLLNVSFKFLLKEVEFMICFL